MVGNKISLGRTPFVRLSIDTLDFACEKHNKSNTYSGALDYRQSVMILGVMCTMFFKVVSFVAVLLSDLFFSIFEGLNLSFDQAGPGVHHIVKVLQP